MPLKVANDATDKAQNNHGRPRELIQNGNRIRYTYDSHGRVLYKTIEPTGESKEEQQRQALQLQLQYNANNELEKSLRTQYHGNQIIKTQTVYHYDTFGRRIAKQSETRNLVKNKDQIRHINKTQYKHTHMLWDSDLPIQEYSDTHVYTTVYDQDSFKPVARLAWLRDDLPEVANDNIDSIDREQDSSVIQVYHYHNDQLGTPNELTNDKGEVVWLADYQAWGNTAKVVWCEQLIDQMQVSQEHLQPIRFQGQHYDEETGLHYNRFRYYDPDVGMFTTRDPIGLMGGDNVFAYAPNPTGWIDPLGLMEIYSHRGNDKEEGYVQNYEFRFTPPADKITEKVAGQVAKKVPALKRLNQLVGTTLDALTGKPSVKSDSKQCTSLDTELVKVYERTGRKANVYTDRVSRNSAEKILNMMRKQNGFAECYPSSTQTILNNADKNSNESLFEKYVTPWAKRTTGQ